MGKAVVKVSEELWRLCTPEPGCCMKVVSNDFPADAQLDNLHFNFNTGQFLVTLYSPSIQGDGEIELKGPVFNVIREE